VEVIRLTTTIFFGLASLLALIYLVFGQNPARLIRQPKPKLHAWAVLCISVGIAAILFVPSRPHSLQDFAFLAPMLTGAALLMIRARAKRLTEGR